MLTVITPTGARPAAFRLCELMMARQDYAAPVRWIIVDDGEQETPLSPPPPRWTQYILRPDPFWRAGDNTQARNLTEALDAAERLREPGEDLTVTVVEDDDWYHPSWLSTIAAALQTAELAGESHARYYNVAVRRASYLNNAFHASLRCSGMRGRGLDALRRSMTAFSTYYDRKMWRDPEPVKRLFRTDLTVGMKGLPGRPGIAAGHREISGAADTDLRLLRTWIGDDADLYAGFYDEDAMMNDRIKMYATGRLKKYENRMLAPGDEMRVTPQQARAFRALKFATDDPPAENGVEPSAAPSRPAKKSQPRSKSKFEAAPADEDTPPAPAAAVVED